VDGILHPPRPASAGDGVLGSLSVRSVLVGKRAGPRTVALSRSTCRSAPEEVRESESSVLDLIRNDEQKSLSYI